MRIASSAVTLSSTHLAAQRSTQKESLRRWVGERRPDFEALERGELPGRGRDLPGADDQRGGAPSGRALAAQRIAGLARRLEADAATQARRAAAAPGPGKPAAKDDDEEELPADAKTMAIKLIVEALTGEKIKVLKLDGAKQAQADAEALSAEIQQATGQPTGQPRRVGWGLEYEYHETYDEVEQTSFSAEGVIKTADGQEIRFEYELEMERQYHSETHVSVRAGDALLKDPLVINFGGTAAQLTEQTYAFDIDADGAKDDVAWVQPGSGFLALDKNGDGVINDGTELFGAQTGDGFAELAAYDDDKNGWIDEADAVYGHLQIWSKSGDADQLASLQDRNVGAILLAQTETPFQLKDAANELQGAVRASGIYVKEDGSGVGSVQQVDLAV
jgi:hypothetical protein